MTPFQFLERTPVLSSNTEKTVPVFALTPDDLKSGQLSPQISAWARTTSYQATTGSLLMVPDQNCELESVVFGLGSKPGEDPFWAACLARRLPSGDWHIEEPTSHVHALAFGLGSYHFESYKKAVKETPRLLVSDADMEDISRQLAGVFLARDLINMPTNDMGPMQLETVFRNLARHYHADFSVITGDDLLEQNFPLIHAVGRASADAPRLLELRWGQKGHRKVTLVGKGVCFDTGGLDIKPAASMLLMKKDMGGAANVMGLALMIMDAQLEIDLRVLIPVVENSISSNAFRPGDIYKSRLGLTVQIDNTDAEGRLILADALAYADEGEPDLLIDMATLTGAARVALGPDLPPFFTDDEKLASDLAEASAEVHDPLWRLPLFKGYEKDLKAKFADLTNAPSGGMAGAITAALFLKKFVTRTRSWAHFDIYGWNASERPHSPVGGEAQAIRALYAYLQKGAR